MPRRLAYQLYHFFWTSLDWLYPPACGGCDQRGERWCKSCQQSVQTISVPLCPHCGQSQPNGEICTRCQTTTPHYQALRSWAVFQGKIRNALHRLKYHRDVGLGEALARPLSEYFRQLEWQVDLVVPVPLGANRMAERGYNQATLLARPLAWANNLSFHAKALWRTRETRSQVGLSAISRQENVAGAFQAKPGFVRDRNVLVVDDVTTSGATLDSCACALLAAGARTIYGLTLARAVLSSTDGISTQSFNI